MSGVTDSVTKNRQQQQLRSNGV